MRSEKMRLGAFIQEAGHHIACWRHPAADPMAALSLKASIDTARTLERAKFDLMFIADGLSIRDAELKAISRTARAVHFEAITHAAAIASVTSRLGIVATASTTFHQPYNIARQFASLDHLTGGRAGWNIVTSTHGLEAANFSMEQMTAHADRYERAEEYVDVVTGLWNTWDEDAMVVDASSGVFFDEARVRLLNHKGKHFSVRGPLNISRSPQGHPVLVQAGASDAGKSLGARVAEIIFTASQTLQEAQDFYSDFKERAKSFGRDADDVKIMPGLCPIVGRDEAQARAKFNELQELIDPDVGRYLLANSMTLKEIENYDVDGPIPDLPETDGMKSRQRLLLDLARREGLTIRQLYMRVAGARGHAQIIGTPAQIADEMEERFMTHGADGFNIMPATLPGGLDDFVELVVPELQRRGLFRTEYEGATLRANVGSRPNPAVFAPRNERVAA